jgi:trk system potassium uptake protein TrkH
VNRTITPIQALLTGFVILIFAGAVLLWLPVSTAGGEHTSFIDALFTSTSAVSTTGLVTVDTGSHYSLFGQIVILILFQVGGLGYMIFIALVTLGIGARVTISGRMLFTESIARPRTIEIKRFIKAVLFFTGFFEVLGVVVLTIVFLQRVSLGAAVYSAVFHSVSAFCTAGFSLYSDSFTLYAADPLANLILAIITIAGGIGFFVLYDVANLLRRLVLRENPRRLSDHSKLVLAVSALLMVGGTIALFFVEGNPTPGASFYDRFLTASFQALSASTTTGFNTVDIGSMHALNLVCIILLMFVGASPGSTGGGIKTTSLGIIVLFIRSVLTNRDDVTAFRRTIATSTVNKALGIGLLASLYLASIVLCLSFSEGFSLLQVFFEAASALGTVGLSTGITPQLSLAGKVLIIITMLIGRVGPLAIGYSLVGKSGRKRYAYPGGNVMVG